MAQPKILADISKQDSELLKINNTGIPYGSKYIGAALTPASNTTQFFLNTIKTPGSYLFIGPVDIGCLNEICNGHSPSSQLIGCLYLLNIYCAASDISDQIIIDDTTGSINQIFGRTIFQTIRPISCNSFSSDDLMQLKNLYCRSILLAEDGSIQDFSEWIDMSSSGGSSITVDTSLSTSSKNPVQNKVVATALKDKLNKSGGTLTGSLVAQANTNYTTYQVRNIALNTTAATPTGNGSILGVYTT